LLETGDRTDVSLAQSIAMNQRGLSLLELLIAVVVIGILAAISIPILAGVKDRARIASARADVRNYMTAQEAYFSDNATYGAWGDLTAPPYSVSVSPGNIGSGVGEAGGYSISISNQSAVVGRNVCHVAVGSMASNPDDDGAVACTPGWVLYLGRTTASSDPLQ
jgi:prepilin-type N-terminal cleavage/methylation domain-containing protein